MREELTTGVQTLSRDERLPELLAARLARPLPGAAVGPRFEPSPGPGRSYHVFPAGAREAAVLILLYSEAGEWRLPLTLRPATLPDHAGQISLPGGRVEPGETTRAAAIRECREELGWTGAAPRLLGALSSIYVFVSNFRVTPWVAVAGERPRWDPSPAEVDAVLEVPLGYLLDPANLGCHEREHHGQLYRAPHFAWQSHRIWGATCMILGELVTVLEEIARAHPSGAASGHA